MGDRDGQCCKGCDGGCPGEKLAGGKVLFNCEQFVVIVVPPGNDREDGHPGVWIHERQRERVPGSVAQGPRLAALSPIGDAGSIEGLAQAIGLIIIENSPGLLNFLTAPER
jgi:hypothetical protein